MNTMTGGATSKESHIGTSQQGGLTNCLAGPEGRFAIVAPGHEDPNRYLRLDAYSSGLAFIEGKFEVQGDIFAAIRHFSNQVHVGFRQSLFSLLAKLEHLKIRFLHGRSKAAQSIPFHYDRSNEFYALFLDSRMIYSEGDFDDPADSLERAQTQKLDRICRDLVLRPGERFLDVGCGWGGLICYAAEHFGSNSYGCTISRQQYEFAQEAVRQHKLENAASVAFCDYRELDGSYDKIASVGMFEHVGRARMPGYFKKVYSLLKPQGLFLNRGIIRFQESSDTPETFFLQKQVFPGGELIRLDEVIREGQRAGFDVIGLRDLREHYALTCRRWVENLQKNAARCRELVGETTYRTWLLYLAASAVSFETASIGAAQVLFSKCR